MQLARQCGCRRSHSEARRSGQSSENPPEHIRLRGAPGLSGRSRGRGGEQNALELQTKEDYDTMPIDISCDVVQHNRVDRMFRQDLKDITMRLQHPKAEPVVKALVHLGGREEEQSPGGLHGA